MSIIRGLDKERILKIGFFTAAASVITVLPWLGFSSEVKWGAIRERGSRCEMCGSNMSTGQLFAHHTLPIQFGGADVPENLTLLCSDCHSTADHNSIFKGKLTNGLRLQEVMFEDPILIGDEERYNKAVQRLDRKRLR